MAGEQVEGPSRRMRRLTSCRVRESDSARSSSRFATPMTTGSAGRRSAICSVGTRASTRSTVPSPNWRMTGSGEDRGSARDPLDRHIVALRSQVSGRLEAVRLGFGRFCRFGRRYRSSPRSSGMATKATKAHAPIRDLLVEQPDGVAIWAWQGSAIGSSLQLMARTPRRLVRLPCCEPPWPRLVRAATAVGQPAPPPGKVLPSLVAEPRRRRALPQPTPGEHLRALAPPRGLEPLRAGRAYRRVPRRVVAAGRRRSATNGNAVTLLRWRACRAACNPQGAHLCTRWPSSRFQRRARRPSVPCR
jgi:hypothetical protein